MNYIVDEDFDQPTYIASLQWANPPAAWSMADSCLEVQPGAKTDYWQTTHYGFSVDNGPFLFCTVKGNFTLSTRVHMHPVNQYDQAGLMVHISPHCWLKASVEYDPEEGGILGRLGSVVTNAGYSDWATQDYGDSSWDLTLRIRRERSDYIVEYTPDGVRWVQMRMAHLAEDDGAGEVRCGLYACSPIAAGYRARFEYLKIQ
jgi:regulation of enolase protein 1 (concanavalin A-like superfamily)